MTNIIGIAIPYLDGCLHDTIVLLKLLGIEEGPFTQFVHNKVFYDASGLALTLKQVPQINSRALEICIDCSDTIVMTKTIEAQFIEAEVSPGEAFSSYWIKMPFLGATFVLLPTLP